MLDGSYGAMCQMEGKSNKSLSGAMCDMCHHLIGRKSKVMDKRIRKSKGANRRLTSGKRGHSHLIMLDQTGEEEKERKEREERKMREKLQLLYTIFEDRWVDFHRANNKRSFARQRLRVGTKNTRFRRGFK